MNLRTRLASVALVAALAAGAQAQDGLGSLQGRSEKLANEAGAAVVGLGHKRPGRAPTVAEVLDSQAGGAGFIIDAKGTILTSSSLVPGEGKVEVIFRGHHRAMARVVGHDSRTHTALLKLDDADAIAKKLGTKTLPHLEFGSSSKLALGRVVATLGNPYSSIQTDGVPAYSLGVVSALGRVRDADGYKGHAIETDAAVNPGSFGGPLVTLDGKVVGLVIEPYSPKRWLGVAVPIDEIRPILADLEAGRTPAPPRLGLSIASATEASLEGVKVASVDADGPAAQGGLKAGDVLVALDGTKVVEAYDIERELGLLSQGTPVEIGVVRDGKRLVLTVTLGAGAQPVSTTTDEEPAPTTKTPPKTADGKPYLGITVDEKDDGLYVKSVVEDGPAGKSKLAPGMKIVQFNGKAVTKKQEILEALNALSPGDTVTIRIENSEGFHKSVKIVLGTKGAPRTEEAPKKTNKPPFLGIGVSQQEDDDAKGLKIDRVLEGSPADKAKLQKGDVLLEIDGKAVNDFESFQGAIRSHSAGDTIKVKVSRDGAEKTLSVTLGERPADLDQQPQRDREPEADAPKRPWVGFALSEKDGKIRVDEVAPGSPAEAAKIKAGFAIVGTDTDDKITIDKLESVIGSKKIGDKIVLKVENEEGWTKTVTLTLAERPKDK